MTTPSIIHAPAVDIGIGVDPRKFLWAILGTESTAGLTVSRLGYYGIVTYAAYYVLAWSNVRQTRGQSNLTKSASRGAHSPVRGHPRGSKVVPLNSWGRVSY